MKNFVVNKFGLVALTVLFLVIYGYFSVNNLIDKSTIPENQILTGDEMVVGNLGGFHFLEDITYSDELTHYRIALHTYLNRSTTIDESIIVPYTKIQQINAEEPIFIDGDFKSTTDLGIYRIQVLMSDTRTFDLSELEIIEIFKGEQKTIINRDPITEIHLVKSSADSTTQIIIGLNRKTKLYASSNNTGTIFIDILK